MVNTLEQAPHELFIAHGQYDVITNKVGYAFEGSGSPILYKEVLEEVPPEDEHSVDFPVTGQAVTKNGLHDYFFVISPSLLSEEDLVTIASHPVMEGYIKDIFAERAAEVKTLLVSNVNAVISPPNHDNVDLIILSLTADNYELPQKEEVA